MKHASLLLSCLLLCSHPLPAQNPTIPEIPRFTLAAVSVGVNPVPVLYWMDIEFDVLGNPVPQYRILPLGEGSRGSSVAIPIPRTQPVQLFGQKNSEMGTPVWEPRITLPERKEGDQLLMVFYQTEEGRKRIYYMEESPESHPAQTVRVVNLSEQNLVVSIGKPELIPPGKETLLGKPDMDANNRFLFSYGATFPTGPWQSPRKALRFRHPHHRLLILYTLMPFYKDTGDGKTSVLTYQPTAYRMFDLAPQADDEDSEEK
jgi:hypothetical protein